MRSILKKARVLFVQENCPFCLIWKQFIERYNANLPLGKQIKIIDCTIFTATGAFTDPLIKVFDNYFDSYPTLFIEGTKLIGTNSRVEAESWLKSRLSKEFIIPEYNTFMHYPNCKYKKIGGIKQLICD